ncbi:MAG: cytochrome c biogenesis protein CcdA [Synergistaceae bacterium]|nr:cytochrome c biogenesis protein CcdA [Synergistaceae bacterium]
MTEILQSISLLIENNVWLAPFLAFAAGALTSLTPCSLSSVPLVIGYVGGAAGSDTRKAFRLSLVFVLGSALTFTALGTAASTVGMFFMGAASWWYLILGSLMVLMALQTWGIFEIIPSSYLMSKNRKKGYLGAFIAGILGGIFSSPCSTPVLIALLAIVAGKGSIIWGASLLILYSIGHGLLVLAVGTSFSFAQKLSENINNSRASMIIKFVLGALVLLAGFYMLYLGF